MNTFGFGFEFEALANSYKRRQSIRFSLKSHILRVLIAIITGEVGLVYANSAIIWVSVVAPRGSPLVETATRTWRPASPSAATRKSEAPFITLGLSWNPFILFTNPPRETIRFRVVKFSVASARMARALRAHSLADS